MTAAMNHAGLLVAARGERGSRFHLGPRATGLVRLVNAERRERRLPALAVHPRLTAVADARVQALAEAGDLDGHEGWRAALREHGVRIGELELGENLARGFRTPAAAMRALMNSPGHRDNILHRGYVLIGAAYTRGFWVQEFGGD